MARTYGHTKGGHKHSKAEVESTLRIVKQAQAKALALDYPEYKVK